MNSLIVLLDSKFAPVVTTPAVTTATGLLVNQRRHQQRGRTAYVASPVVVSVSPPVLVPVAVTTATGLLTNQRRYQQRRVRSFLEPIPATFVARPVVVVPESVAVLRRPRGRRIVAYVSPPVLVVASTIVASTVTVVTPFDHGRRRRRPLSTTLFPPIIPTTTFVAAPLDVTTVALRPRHRRTTAYVAPPTRVIGATPFIATPTVATPPFDHGRRRRRPLSTALFPPIISAATFVASPIDVTTVAAAARLRYRIVRGRRALGVGPINGLPAPDITTVRTWLALGNRVTRVRRGPHSVLLRQPITTSAFIATPTVATPPFDHGRRRRRPLSTALFPPTVLQTFAGPVVKLQAIQTRVGRQRRRLPSSFLQPPVFYPATSDITVAIVRTRPRPTRHALTAVSYPATSDVLVTLAGGTRQVDRRRGTRSVLSPPTVLQTFQGPTVALTRIRPRKTHATLGALIFYRQSSEITATIVRTRPRKTRWFLTNVTYPQVTPVSENEVAIKTVLDDRRRRGVHSTLNPPVFYAQTSTVTVAIVRTRRVRTHSSLPLVIVAATIGTFPGAAVTVARTRPRRTHSFLTDVVYPATSAIQTRVVTTRPRRTHSFLTSISYPTASVIRVTNVRARPRHTRSFLTEVSYPATSQIQTHLVHTRPRPTRHSLTAVSYPATSVIDVTTVRTRPRHTRSFLTAVTYPQATPIVETEVFVKTVVDDRRRRGTRSFITNVSYPASSSISTKLVATRPRRTHSFLTAVSYPATSVVRVVTVRIRPRRTHSFLTAVSYPSTSQIQAHLARTRPRPTRHSLTAVTYPQVTPVVEAQVAVKTVVDDRRRRSTHSSLTSVSYPATSSITTRLVTTRPRRTRWFLTSVSYPATSAIRVVTARTRPRGTRSFLTSIAYSVTTAFVGPPISVTTVAAATRLRYRIVRGRAALGVGPINGLPAPDVTTVKTWLSLGNRVTRIRRAPHSVLRKPVVVAAATFATPAVAKTVQTRPRPKRVTLTPPTTLQVFRGPVEAEIFVKTVVDDRRRRGTHSFFVVPVTYPATSVIRTTLAHTRPRPTRHILTAVTYAATSSISTQLVTTRPRKTHSFLTNVSYAATSVVVVKRVRTRPRPTRYFLAPPTTLQVFPGPVEAEVFVKTVQDDRRRRAPKSFATKPVTYPQTSEITVSTVRSRPRHTRSFLTSVSYPATSVIATRLVQTRPRRTHYSLTAVSYPATSVILTKTVRTRPRPTASSLAAPTVLTTFPGPTVVETRIRPRHIRSTVFPPTVVRVPSVEQLEETIKVALVRTRPRPTSRKLAPPTVIITNPPVVTTLRVTLVAVPTRVGYRRHVVEHFLSPPTVVIPLPTLRMQTVATTLVRARPRPVHTRLTAVTYPATSVIRTHIVTTRPRPTLSVVAPPTTLKTFSGPSVSTTRIRPRHTTHRVAPPVFYAATSEISVTTVRVQPRPTTHLLSRPTTLRVFPGPVETEVAVQTVVVDRHRRTVHSRLSPPVISAAFGVIHSTLARTRPRHVRSFLTPPTVVASATFAGPRVSLTRLARRHTLSRLPVVIVAARRASTFAVTVTATRIRPRHVLSRLSPPTVVSVAPVVEQTVRVVIAPPRPRVETLARLNPIPPIAPLFPAWTTGETLPAAATEGEDVAAASTGGETVAGAASQTQDQGGARASITDVGSALAEVHDELGGLPT